MKEIDLAREALGVPKPCYKCPAVGTCVVEYSVLQTFQEEYGTEAMGDDFLDRHAQLLAEKVGISLNEAKEFVRENVGRARQVVGDILDRNETTAAHLQVTTTQLVENCEGAELVHSSTGPVFECRSPYLAFDPNNS